MTTTVALSSFLPYVLPHVPGCPTLAIRKEVTNAAIRFCELTEIWNEFAAAVNIVASTHTYTIPTPDNAQVDAVDEVWVNGAFVLPANRNELKLIYPNWNTASGATALYHTQINPDELRIIPIPTGNITNGLVVRATYKPIPDATTLPAILHTNYAEAIAAGAIAKICEAPGKSWSNPEKAKECMARFLAEIESAAVRARKSFNYSRQAPQ